MSVFTPSEIEYLTSQRICRVATVSTAGEPHVVPVRFRYNPELNVIEIGGQNFGKGVEVRGLAEAIMEGGEEIFRGADPEFVRITPTHIASWGVDSDNFTPISRKVG
jgi:pyridoxamine 5'-phosphate oxidase family protein